MTVESLIHLIDIGEMEANQDILKERKFTNLLLDIFKKKAELIYCESISNSDDHLFFWKNKDLLHLVEDEVVKLSELICRISMVKEIIMPLVELNVLSILQDVIRGMLSLK